VRWLRALDTAEIEIDTDIFLIKDLSKALGILVSTSKRRSRIRKVSFARSAQGGDRIELLTRP
jgi:hypothetical protein